MKEVQVNGQNICLANIDGKYFAINNICSHEGGPLADGRLEGYEVECPWHQSKFDMRTGQVKVPPAVEPQVTYQVKVEGEDVLINAGSVTTEVKTEFKQVESSDYKLILKERQVLEGTDILSLKFNKHAEDNNRIFDYVAGQFVFLILERSMMTQKARFDTLPLLRLLLKSLFSSARGSEIVPIKRNWIRYKLEQLSKCVDHKENLLFTKTIQNLPYFFLEE